LDTEKISLLEQKETIEPEILEKVAKALNVPVEAIENFSEESVFNNYNTFNDHSALNATMGYYNYQPTFNPIDKVAELYESKIELLERMLKEKDETIILLKNMLKK
jgi:hypothetical protein